MPQTARKPRVSVVIPAYRRRDLLHKTLLSLFQQDLDSQEYEVLVVDSSPDDQNIVLVQELATQSPCYYLGCLSLKNPRGPRPVSATWELRTRAASSSPF